MYKSLKIVTLYLLKYSGIFTLAKVYYRNRPRIICYHGFSILDEAEFIPGTFIKKETFIKRIKLLQKLGCQFTPLEDITKESHLPKLPIILTFDDGFVSTLTEGLPFLESNNIPATLYVTTYYHLKLNPIFRLHFKYLLWKTNLHKINSNQFSLKVPFEGEIDLKSYNNSVEILKEFEEKRSEEERALFLDELEKALGVSLTEEQRKKSFTIASAEQLKDAQKRNLDLQLHTHRHRLPINKEECIKEIRENREILKEFTQNDLVHFCYPSGIYDQRQFPWLEEAEVLTATTLVPGIVKKGSHPLELPRILDNEQLSLIQFEAEVCGVGDLLRSLKAPFSKTGPNLSAT